MRGSPAFHPFREFRSCFSATWQRKIKRLPVDALGRMHFLVVIRHHDIVR